MADILRLLKSLDPSVTLDLRESWGAENPNHRLEIHAALPNSATFTSVSHAPGLGGFVTSQQRQIGLDVERLERIREPVIERIASAEERRRAPDSRLLWSAKEASFKALRGPHQPPVISSIVISQWMPLEPGAWIFRAQAAVEGVIILNSSHSIAVSFAVSN